MDPAWAPTDLQGMCSYPTGKNFFFGSSTLTSEVKGARAGSYTVQPYLLACERLALSVCPEARGSAAKWLLWCCQLSFL